MIPYSTLEPIKQKLSNGFQVESDQKDKKLWSSIFQNQLFNTQVNLKVELGETEIELDDLMNLKVGDVIRLNQGRLWRISFAS